MNMTERMTECAPKTAHEISDCWSACELLALLKGLRAVPELESFFDEDDMYALTESGLYDYQTDGEWGFTETGRAVLAKLEAASGDDLDSKRWQEIAL